MKRFILIPLLFLSTFLFSAEVAEIEDCVDSFLNSGNYIKIKDYTTDSGEVTIKYITKEEIISIDINRYYQLEINVANKSYNYNLESIKSDYKNNIIIVIGGGIEYDDPDDVNYLLKNQYDYYDDEEY